MKFSTSVIFEIEPSSYKNKAVRGKKWTTTSIPPLNPPAGSISPAILFPMLGIQKLLSR